MRGNTVRVVLSPTAVGALRSGVSRALNDRKESDCEDLKISIPERVVHSNVQSTDVITGDQTVQHEAESTAVVTTSFVDAAPGEEVIFQPVLDPSFTDVYNADASLSTFLCRPVLISSLTWTEATTISGTFNPWNLYFNNSVIKNKLENFQFINCTLHVKVLINASPFYYGILGFFYEPLTNISPAPIDQGITSKWWVNMSQRPHIWAYPTNSEGGEMELPFLYPKNWLDLTTLADFTNMGEITYQSFTNLLNANSVAGSDCDIQIYAWASNVKICGPTVSAALQAGERKKKASGQNTRGGSVADNGGSSRNYNKSKSKSVTLGEDLYDGSHEGTSNGTSGSGAARAQASKGLFPYLSDRVEAATGSRPSDYLRDASNAAKVVAKTGSAMGYDMSYITAAANVGSIAGTVAAGYGYTDVPITDPVQPFKDLPFHAFSSAEISSPLDKLTLDPKNQLAIDPSTTGGTSVDELTIDALCRRESYIFRVKWLATDPVDHLLMTTRVTPCQHLVETQSGTNYRVYKTPMDLVSNLFQYWRGNIVFRFRFIASKYHRGRVRITWDPSTDLGALTATNTSNFNRVIDIAAEPDVRISVPYLQATSFLKTCTAVPTDTVAETAIAPVAGVDNGQLSMRVFTQQTSPVANADIHCVISTYAENMEFAGPVDLPKAYSYYAIQSQDVNFGYNENGIAEPLFTPTEVSSDAFMVYMGEYISSTQQLMRRTCKVNSAYWPADGASRTFIGSIHQCRMPLYSGYDPNGINSADDLIGIGQSAFNFVQNTPVNWIGACFVCHRGSMNWHFNVTNTTLVPSITIRRDTSALAAAEYADSSTVTNGTDTSQCLQQLWSATSSGGAGQSLLHQATQTGASAVVPMYTNTRFYGNSPIYRTEGTAFDNSTLDGFRIEAEISPADGVNAKYLKIDQYCAIGADFAFHFFLNVPTMWYMETLPTGNDP